MWRCPRCVTHCKDEQTACPVCKHARPDKAVDSGEKDWSDLDAMFPPKVDLADEEDQTHPLLPALHKRDVEQKLSRFWSQRAFWIAGVSLMVVISLDGVSKGKDFFAALAEGAGLGAVVG